MKGAGEMAQWVRTQSDLAEDPGSSPNTHTACDSSSREILCLVVPSGGRDRGFQGGQSYIVRQNKQKAQLRQGIVKEA